jgi:hypothetical protein
MIQKKILGISIMGCLALAGCQSSNTLFGSSSASSSGSPGTPQSSSNGSSGGSNATGLPSGSSGQDGSNANSSDADNSDPNALDPAASKSFPPSGSSPTGPNASVSKLHDSNWYKQYTSDSSPPATSGTTSDVVSFNADSGSDDSAQSQVPVTIGQVFADNAVSNGAHLTATINGVSIPTQVDKKATWPDGSHRHAVISVRIPTLNGNTSKTVTLETGNKLDDGTNPVTISDLLKTNFSASLTLQVQKSGLTYHADAAALLKKLENANCPYLGLSQPWPKKEGQCSQWLRGALVSEWLISAPLKTASGKKSPHLRAYFYIRAYVDTKGAVSRARVNTVIENDWAYVSGPHNIQYNAKITVGKQKYTTEKPLDHYRQARWHKVLWWGEKPDVYAQLNGKYIQKTKAVSLYENVQPQDTFLDDKNINFPPMTNGNQTPHMGNVGAQPSIGPLPRWTSAYIVSMKPRAFAWMLANDDAVGSYGFHYRDKKTGRPLMIQDHPYVTILNKWAYTSKNPKYKPDLLPLCQTQCGSPYIFDTSHHPSIGYVPYMVTGDFYYLEELQFTASFIELNFNEAYRQHAKGRLRVAEAQVRGQAWGLRTLTDAAFITPDQDPLKKDFRDEVENNLQDYLDNVVGKPEKHPLHLLISKPPYKLHGEEHVGIATWQADFFTWAIGHAAEQGFAKAAALLNWFAKFQINMMTNWEDKPDGGYCWLMGSAYTLQIRDSRDNSEYTSLDEAYRKSFPQLAKLTCDTMPYLKQMKKLDGHTYQKGEMYGYADSATGYPSNLQIGLAMAAESDRTNARQAWEIFENRSVKPRSHKAYNNYPNFAVIPRNY